MTIAPEYLLILMLGMYILGIWTVLTTGYSTRR